ncbi:MAG: UbiD family decarboxylase [Bacillota bacterium]
MDVNGNIISDDDIENIKHKLSQLIYLPLERFHRNIKVIGYITFLLKKININPIIVGGHAVELYTAGHYTTFDVDLVLSGYNYAREILESLGFNKNVGERHWYHKELALAIEIPDNILCGSMDKVIEVTDEEGYCVYVIGIEDLILDRVRAAIYWNSSSDREWAFYLMNAQWDDIDLQYLKDEAKRESENTNNPGVYNLVLELIGSTEELKNSK